VHEEAFGMMVALRGTRELKLVPIERYAEAEVFFG